MRVDDIRGEFREQRFEAPYGPSQLRGRVRDLSRLPGECGPRPWQIEVGDVNTGGFERAAQIATPSMHLLVRAVERRDLVIEPPFVDRGGDVEDAVLAPANAQVRDERQDAYLSH